MLHRAHMLHSNINLGRQTENAMPACGVVIAFHHQEIFKTQNSPKCGGLPCPVLEYNVRNHADSSMFAYCFYTTYKIYPSEMGNPPQLKNN